jgi:hypothetical protein
MSILPTICEPSLRFSVSAALVRRIAVPAAPAVLAMVPELVMVVPLVVSNVPIPILPEMVPELATEAEPTWRPKLLAAVAWIVPEFSMAAAMLLTPPMPPMSEPRLEMVAVVALIANSLADMVPGLTSVRLLPLKALDPPNIVPELKILASAAVTAIWFAASMSLPVFVKSRVPPAPTANPPGPPKTVPELLTVRLVVAAIPEKVVTLMVPELLTIPS